MLIKYVSDTQIIAVASLIWHRLFITSHLIQKLEVLVQNDKVSMLKLMKWYAQELNWTKRLLKRRITLFYELQKHSLHSGVME